MSPPSFRALLAFLWAQLVVLMPEDYFCILISTQYLEVVFVLPPFIELATQSIWNKDLNQEILAFLKTDF